MRIPAAFALLFAAFAASAQAPAAPPAPACPECGVVRSVKRVESAVRPSAAEERKGPSGFVANIPLDGGKPKIGSSTDLGREQRAGVVSYEIVVRLDDGRFQVVLQEDAGGLREGDKVRVERGKVVLRER